MALFYDGQLGFKKETSYGTATSVDRFLEFKGDETLNEDLNIKQGTGLRVGSRVARSARRVVVTREVKGDITVEAVSKGMGAWWEILVGAGASTLVTTGTYQQVFTLADAMPSATVQIGRPDLSGTVRPFTFAGIQCVSFELAFPQADILTVKGTFNGKSVSTATGLASASYAASQSLFTFAGGVLSTGSFTAPTSTALAAGATELANVRSGSIMVNHNINVDRYNFGNAGLKSKPNTNLREVTGQLEIEYADNTFVDAIMNQTAMSFVGTWTADDGAVLQVAIPDLKINPDGLPKTNNGELILQSLTFDVLDNLSSAQPIWVVMRTSDSAL